jgi:iron(III) transport system permease protein
MTSVAKAIQRGIGQAGSSRLPSPLWLVLAAVFFLVLTPIALLIHNSFDVSGPTEGYRFGLLHYRSALSDPEVAPAMWNTVKIVSTRMSIGFVVAVLLAWLVTRTNIPHATWLDFGMWLSFFMPGLAVIQGWIFLFEGQTGLANQWIANLPFIEESPFDVFSFWGLIWVHLMAQVLSTHFVLFTLAFRNMDGQLEEAARVSGATVPATARRVTLPLMRPIFGMVAVLAIIRGMQSFETERILGTPAGIDVYATLLVTMVTEEVPRMEEGIVLSVIVLMSLIPLIFIQRIYVGKRQYTTVSSRMKPTITDIGRWRWPAFIFVAIVIALLTIVPFISLVAGSLMTRWGYFDIENVWTLKHWKLVLSDDIFLKALFTTLRLGVIAAFVSMGVLFTVAYVLVRTKFRGNSSLDFVSWLPWALPGVLLSLGVLMSVLQIPFLQFLHGTSVILIIALLLFRFPIGVHLIRTGMMQVSKELEEAAQISGARWWYVQFRIVRPILMPMLLGVGLIAFISTLNEVSGVILLASTQTRTLSLLTLDYLIGAGGSKEAASVITVVIMLLAIVAVVIGRRFGLKLASNG